MVSRWLDSVDGGGMAGVGTAGRGRALPGMIALAASGLLIGGSLLIARAEWAGLDWKNLSGIPSTSTATRMLPGLTLEDVPVARGGIVVTSRRSDSSAAPRGIAVGDIITAMDHHAVHDLSGASRYLRRDKSDTLQLTIMRGHRPRLVRLIRAGGGRHGT